MISFCLKTLPGLRVEIPVTLPTFNQTTSNLSAIYQSAEERSIIMLSSTEANFVTKSSSTLTSSSIPVPSPPKPPTFVPRYNNLVNGLEIYIYIHLLCVYIYIYIIVVHNNVHECDYFSNNFFFPSRPCLFIIFYSPAIERGPICLITGKRLMHTQHSFMWNCCAMFGLSLN